MAEFLKKLTVVMFYAALPLLIPLFYSLYVGDEGWIPIGITILVLALPAVPHIVMTFFENIINFIKSIVSPETPFNYAEIINISDMRKEVETLTLGQILAITSVAWILIPAISTIPYAYYGIPLIDAFFESMSAWTSTGLSALPTLQSLPPSLILFRSITQWVGGLGIVILILTVVKGREAIGFLKAEGRQTTEVGIGETIGIIFKTYFVLTLLGIIMLSVLGIDIFNAVNLTFSGISNGGFFPFDTFEFTDLQKFALAMLMFAGATSFIFYRNIWEGIPKKSIFDEEFILFVIITITAIFLIAYIAGESFYNTVLNTISSIASGGFAIGDLSVLHAFPLYLLILLMLSGGMVGSTTGGIKLWRILVIFKAVGIQIKKAFLPSGSVQVVKINNAPISEHMIADSAIFVFTYLFLFLFGAGMFIASDYSLNDALFIVASALGNVGLSTVSVPTVGSLGKAFLILLMYLGRIEIFPSLVLISYIIRR
jgi:trk system potassium uptake protein TrkH